MTNSPCCVGLPITRPSPVQSGFNRAGWLATNARFLATTLCFDCMHGHLTITALLPQLAGNNKPITESQEACRGRLLLESTDLSTPQDSESSSLPCHINIIKPAAQQNPSSSQYTFNTGRRLLQATDNASEHDTDLSSKAPDIKSSHASNSKVPNVQDMPTKDVDLVADAADQQAMQHGTGALGTTSRELHRQLGQRFDKPSADRGSAQRVATAGQKPSDQPEITPGIGLMHNHAKPLSKLWLLLLPPCLYQEYVAHVAQVWAAPYELCNASLGDSQYCLPAGTEHVRAT